MRIFIDPNCCTGCQSCVIACAYHHTRTFNNKVASIDVSLLQPSRLRRIVVYTHEKNGHKACNMCKEEPEPLCIKYCSTKAISVR